jgi:hypothetical protein
MLISITVPASAKEVQQKVVFDGVTYTISEGYEGDTKVVKVTGGGEESIVKLTADTMEIKDTGAKQSTKFKIDDSLSAVKPTAGASKTTASKYSLYWNYSYYYSDSRINTSGMYFSLSSGNTYGRWAGFDSKNLVARDKAYEFCSEVRDLDSNLWAASAASGASAGAIAAAIASAGPTAGIGTIIGIVAAILAGGVAIAEWVAAYNSSLDCNQLFLQFKHAL